MTSGHPTGRPNARGSVRDRFQKQWGDRVAQDKELRLVSDRLFDLYEEKGFLPDGGDKPLHKCCENAAACWEGSQTEGRDWGISFPWIGRDYLASRVVLVGMNFDNSGGFEAHYWICSDHIKTMRGGGRGKDGRSFSRGAMRYLAAVLDSIDEGDRLDSEGNASNESLANLWETCAYVQAVKCSPRTERSVPTDAMFSNCPSFVLSGELAVLEPRVIVIFGRSEGGVRDNIRPWAVPSDGYGVEQGPRIERDLASIAREPVELISLNHPSSPNPANVESSLAQLRKSLAANPLGAPPLQSDS